MAFNMEDMIVFMQAELRAEMREQDLEDGFDPEEMPRQIELYGPREQQVLEKIGEFWEAIDLHAPNYPGWREDGWHQGQPDFDLEAVIIPKDLGDIATQLSNIVNPLVEEMEENPGVDFEDWRFWHKYYDDDRYPFLFGRTWNDLDELVTYIVGQYEFQQMPLPMAMPAA